MCSSDLADIVLLSQEAVAERCFLVDVRPGENCSSVTVAGHKITLEQLSGRDWVRLQLVTRSGQSTVFVNDKPVLQNVPAAQTAFSLAAEGSAQFANIYVRPAP